jgi:phosphate transport system substrate-binding protein
MRLYLLKVLFIFTLLPYAYGKDTVRITGSASVYPVISYIYENAPSDVKDAFVANPVIESVGTGAGFDSFCKQNFGSNSPDIVNASREITPVEITNCKANNITQIQKITVGLDGIVLAYSSEADLLDDSNFTLETLYKALSKYILINDEVVLNNTNSWSEINSTMPNVKIIIYGPNSNSGTFDFIKDVVKNKCLSDEKVVSYIKSIGKNPKTECSIFRKNVYIEMPDQDSTIARKLDIQKSAIGVLRFNFFENSGKYESLNIDGVEPDEDDIISGKYPLARPLFVYYDASYLPKVTGLKEFLIQVAKFSYRDLSNTTNEYHSDGSSEIVVENKNNTSECLKNKKIIGFEFNC